MRLTGANIRALTLPEGATDKIFFDDDLPGFGLRIRATGSKTWYVQYAIAGKTRRIPLGTLAHLDPGKARETAKNLLAKTRLGGDPVAEKHQAHARANETMGVQLPRFIQQSTKLRPSSYNRNIRNLEVYSKSLHTTPIAEIDRRKISALLSKITQERGPSAAYSLR
jgi:hypothetical protein